MRFFLLVVLSIQSLSPAKSLITRKIFPICSLLSQIKNIFPCNGYDFDLFSMTCVRKIRQNHTNQNFSFAKKLKLLYQPNTF